MDKKIVEENMYPIMAKILGNEASLTERLTFKAWLKESFENQSIWEDVQMIWNRRKQHTTDSSFNPQNAWRKLSLD